MNIQDEVAIQMALEVVRKEITNLEYELQVNVENEVLQRMDVRLDAFKIVKAFLEQKIYGE